MEIEYLVVAVIYCHIHTSNDERIVLKGYFVRDLDVELWLMM